MAIQNDQTMMQSSIQSSFKNIESFFCDKQIDLNWRSKPALIKWLEATRMTEALKIFDSKIQRLIALGARGKLNQWLLSDDRDFNSITAERYTIDFLKIKNTDLSDNI